MYNMLEWTNKNHQVLLRQTEDREGWPKMSHTLIRPNWLRDDDD